MKEPRISGLKNAIMLAGFVIAIFFFLLAYIQKHRADAQTLIAEECYIEAKRQRQIAEGCRVQLDAVKKELEACSSK